MEKLTELETARSTGRIEALIVFKKTMIEFTAHMRKEAQKDRMAPPGISQAMEVVESIFNLLFDSCNRDMGVDLTPLDKDGIRSFVARVNVEKFRESVKRFDCIEVNK